MTVQTETSYYAILTFGPTISGRKRNFYRSESAARQDADNIVGPCTIRIGRYATRKEAINADISE
jgi:hypothetical protein